MPGYAELKKAFDSLGIADNPVIVHASLRKFGNIDGGARTVIQAILASFSGVVVPAFTYKTMITPEVGPPNNGLNYGSDKDNNKMAESFRPDMPPDKMMGTLPLTLLHEKNVLRTSHPILSFAGIRADEILRTQTLFDPLAPIRELEEKDGWVVLINVDNTVNTSIHYGEKLAGRRQFVRWAMMPGRIVECPGFPGDSSGFHAIDEYISPYTCRVDMGKEAFIQALPVKRLLDATVEMIKKDPLALLCQRVDCERCNAVRI
ncbi:MAG TPA: AAC(3) family N-acetyltransferase [Anaerolineales bacterium]